MKNHVGTKRERFLTKRSCKSIVNLFFFQNKLSKNLNLKLTKNGAQNVFYQQHCARCSLVNCLSQCTDVGECKRRIGWSFGVDEHCASLDSLGQRIGIGDFHAHSERRKHAREQVCDAWIHGALCNHQVARLSTVIRLAFVMSTEGRQMNRACKRASIQAKQS